VQKDDDFIDFAGSSPEDRTAVVDLADLGTRRGSRPDRHLLVGVHGSQLGQVLRLDMPVCHIGRHQDSELWLNDSGVSRRHAEIEFDGQVYMLKDLGSANGTFVRGQRVIEHRLEDGDVIQFGPGAVFRYSLADKEQEDMLRQLYAASVTDALTGARTREYFDTHLESELSYARRHRTEVALVMFDIDHFKRVNDTYGHQAGDAVLVEIAAAVTKIVRNEDVFARYGGEEFAMILRDIDIVGAEHAGERLRQTISALCVTSGAYQISVTVSVGCAALAECGEPVAEQLIATADRRLYAAKRSGRNCVIARDD
jgi:diguanylate cyclase (GGDEF)-like protein